MFNIRRALQGYPSHCVRSAEFDGRQLNFQARYFDLGKGLAACLVKNWWEHDAHSLKIPTKFDELSRYYLLKKRLQFSDPQLVCWVHDSGLMTNSRSQLEVTPLSPSSQRLRHMDEMFDTDSLHCIMNYVHAASQTREKQSFTLMETLENLWELNAYTLYPLNHGGPNQRDVVMMTKTCLASTIRDSQKIFSVEWGEGLVNR